MRIRTQLILAIAILVTALLVIAGSIIVTNQQVDRLSKQEVLAKNIETEANDLTYLSSDYILYPDTYQAGQWQSKYLALASDTSILTVDTPEQQVLVNNLKANQRRLKNVFDDVQSSNGNTSPGYPPIDPLATRISWGRLTVQTQGIIADSAHLSQLLHDEIEQVKMLGNLLIFLMMGTFSLFILSSYLIVYRRTLNSIEDLQNGTKIIGSGDLDHMIPEKGDDEIRDLSRAFNKMTVNLKGVTASKAEIELVVTDRKKAEAELGQRNEELSAMNEELTASQEELHQNIEELTKAEAELRQTSQYLENLINYANAPIIVWDKDFRITRFNHAFERLTGRKAKATIGQSLEILFPEKYTRHAMDIIGETIGGERLDVVEIPILQQSGTVRTVLWNTATLYEADGETILSVIAQGQDITERRLAENALMRRNEDLNVANVELTATQEKLLAANNELIVREREIRANESALQEALTEKDVLLSEIHHRVKNNLAAFISLLSLGGSYEETPEGQSLKKDLQNRARSMALIHETLYQTRKFSKVDMGVYLNTLVGQIAGSYSTVIRTIVCAEGVNIDIARATPCGLIINELITNSFKYAFPESYDCRAVRGEPCTIRVCLVNEEGIYSLSVSDNGIGLPQKVDPRSTQTLGLKLVNFLARHQLRANVMVDTSAGTMFTVRFTEQG